MQVACPHPTVLTEIRDVNASYRAVQNRSVAYPLPPQAVPLGQAKNARLSGRCLKEDKLF